METVELIASGYEWMCPACDRYNREVEVTETVECHGCYEKFEVTDYHHAIA